jgi:hypothetical protein
VTGISGEGWKILTDGDDSENIPLWRALARFRSDDLDEGRKANATVINRARPIFRRYYNAAFLASLAGGVLSFIVFFVMWIAGRSSTGDALFPVGLALLAVATAPQLGRQIYQYGVATPDDPLALPHDSDRHFDEFLGYLQRASGPQAYYKPRFGKKREALDRQQFLGRLRYFLFSEHDADRRLVMRFRSGWALPSDIFVHRDDLERMIALTKPKRKGGPGRNLKYTYAEAVIELIGDPRLDTLDLNDEPAATHAITDWLDQWFKAAADESGDTPRRDQLTPYAKKIYAHLRKLATH